MQNHDQVQFLTGWRKFLFYFVMGIKVAFRYLPRRKEFGGVVGYFRFLLRAAAFTQLFNVHKLVKIGKNKYKLDFYMPAYPTPAFFESLENKLLHFPPRPITAVLSITKACSYKCKHCYQSLAPMDDLSEEQLLQTAVELRKAGVCAFAIEGGEPLLKFSRLLKLCEVLKDSELWINSTGFSYTSDMLRELKDAGVLGIMTSIHSVVPAEHDEFTGVKGAYDLACRFIKECKKHGLCTGLNTTLEEDAVINGEIQNIMELAKSLNCDFVQLIQAKPSGKWLGRPADAEKLKSSIEIAKAQHVLYNSYRKKDYPVLSAQVFEEQESMLGCTAGGIDRFYVNANGEVQPCEFLNISFGNINNEPFEEIFKRMRFYFKIPGIDWPCCSKADQIAEYIAANNLKTTPVPWPMTRKIVEQWKESPPTPIYQKLGIYK
jgi:MoaA/NifB/PqqE/SkfB family radical SAM enzyme